MDPPPLPPLPTPTVSGTSNIVSPTTIHLNYPDSVESSPRSHAADTYNNEPLPPVPGAKLRLMCSYGGHIIPRPHDKSLCYVGGETRMVAIDRHSTLSSLSSRLSRGLLDGRSFTLKYQLPNEELDSLVSVTTDEDLDNMIEEYDRITASSSALAPSRIRLFVFFNKPETVASMGSLLDDAKSETWFVDALNGSLLPRNLSDSATMECLVNLDSDHDLEAQVDGVDGNKQEIIKNQVPVLLHHEVQATMPDSPMMENGSSSFGSSSSSPSMCNLPPIRVRVEDQKVGIEEQFAQMTFAQAVQKQYDGYGLLATAVAPLPPLPTAVAAAGMASSLSPAGGSSEHLNRVLSDDERSDQGVPVTFRKKPPLPLQPVQHKAGACGYNLPSPDSVASDTSSIASASSFSKPMHYQEQVATGDSKLLVNPDTKCDISVPSSQIQIQQAQNSAYASPAQFDQQQQFVPTSTHFFPHPATTPLPMSSYYPIYATQQQQPHQPIDQHQQYPVYVMPVAQTQPYMSVQSNLMDTTTVMTSGRPPTPNSHPPPLYPTKVAAGGAATLAKHEMAASMYRTAVTPTPSLIPMAAGQYQQQYVGYAPNPMQYPTQSIAVAPAAASGANYGYEYAKGPSDQVYYTQIQSAPVPSQYQSMNPAAAAALADASNQLSTSATTMHQNGTPQPI
ncbi:conserved hypothetical protein [Ricinus communis]|uniref:PB1 domain-containing protein n=1 Tax=Ricinus communis TaxID=3988 RepID=B9SFW2_RICCO|nr:conserved hypothetical protein [Ricinus communis]|eukprot:XP_002524881.1 uncharacterized protein LOC8286387 [Ricinus communis]